MQCLGACGICVPSLLTVRLAFRETGVLGGPQGAPCGRDRRPWWSDLWMVVASSPWGLGGRFPNCVIDSELTGISYKEKPSLVKDPLTLKRTITFNSLFITF